MKKVITIVALVCFASLITGCVGCKPEKRKKSSYRVMTPHKAKRMWAAHRLSNRAQGMRRSHRKGHGGRYRGPSSVVPPRHKSHNQGKK